MRFPRLRQQYVRATTQRRNTRSGTSNRRRSACAADDDCVQSQHHCYTHTHTPARRVHFFPAVQYINHDGNFRPNVQTWLGICIHWIVRPTCGRNTNRILHFLSFDRRITQRNYKDARIGGIVLRVKVTIYRAAKRYAPSDSSLMVAFDCVATWQMLVTL